MKKEIFGWILLFSLVSAIFLFIAVLLWGVNNDLVIYEVNEQAQALSDSNIITDSAAVSSEAAGNAHANLVFYFDWWWLASYIIMVLTTIAIAYFSREEEYFSFLGILFFGTMFVLFILGIIYPLTDWWINDLLYKILPGIQGKLPMFEHYNANIGMYSFIHMLVCIFANRIYFKVNDYIKKPGFSDEEVI